MREQKKTKSQEIEEFYNPFPSLAFAFLGKNPTEYMQEMVDDYQQKILFLVGKQKEEMKLAFLFQNTKPCIYEVFKYRLRRARKDFQESTVKDFIQEFESKPLTIAEHVIIGGLYQKYYAEAANSNERKKKMIEIIDFLNNKENIDTYLWNMFDSVNMNIDFYLKYWDTEERKQNAKVVNAQRIASIG